jgi:uroporphyrin-III C-methyltransferase
LPGQRTCFSSLQQMQQAALDFQLKSPAILLIGEVAERGTVGLPVSALAQIS